MTDLVVPKEGPLNPALRQPPAEAVLGNQSSRRNQLLIADQARSQKASGPSLLRYQQMHLSKLSDVGVADGSNSARTQRGSWELDV